MKGKNGWIRILEATIAVLIVSGAIIAVYSNHPSRGESMEEQAYSLQRQILDEVAMDEGLRLAVLNIETDLPGDVNYDVLDDFVAESIPDGFGYLLRVCIMGDDRDFCKMDRMSFTATQDHDIFVEDVLISAEIGNGSGEEVYSPKKVRLFFWEGGWPPDFCRDECVRDVLDCSTDSRQVVNRTCTYNTTSGCFDYGATSVVESCNASALCINNVCVESLYSELVCTGIVYGRVHCRASPDCSGHDGRQSLGDCGPFDLLHEYRCYDYVTVLRACSLNPTPCPTGYNTVSRACML